MAHATRRLRMTLPLMGFGAFGARSISYDTITCASSVIVGTV
jgi:hypothetical protein